MEGDPGNFSLLFKPVFISTSPVCPAAVYLYNCLCGLFPSSATKTWLYFMLIFNLFCVFYPLRCESMLPSSASLRKHPLPWIFQSISFSCTHVYITNSDFRPLTSYLYADAFPLWAARTGGVLRRFWLRRFTEQSLSPTGVAPTLGYLLLFLTVCPLEQNGGLLFLLLWYEGEGEAVRGGRETLGVNGGGRERRRGESSWVFGIVRKSVPCSFCQRPVSIGRGQWRSSILPPWHDIYCVCVCKIITYINISTNSNNNSTKQTYTSVQIVLSFLFPLNFLSWWLEVVFHYKVEKAHLYKYLYF